MNAQELQPLIEYYLFASTPDALLRRLCGEEAVRRLSRDTTIPDLRRAYATVAAKPKKTLEDVTLCYTYLAALDLRGALRTDTNTDIERYDLDWVDMLKAMR